MLLCRFARHPEEDPRPRGRPKAFRARARPRAKHQDHRRASAAAKPAGRGVGCFVPVRPEVARTKRTSPAHACAGTTPTGRSSGFGQPSAAFPSRSSGQWLRGRGLCVHHSGASASESHRLPIARSGPDPKRRASQPPAGECKVLESAEEASARNAIVRCCVRRSTPGSAIGGTDAVVGRRRFAARARRRQSVRAHDSGSGRSRKAGP